MAFIKSISKRRKASLPYYALFVVILTILFVNVKSHSAKTSIRQSNHVSIGKPKDQFQNNISNLSRAHLANNKSIFNYNKIKSLQRRSLRESICDIGCDCRQETSFITVFCDFTKNKITTIFGSQIHIPEVTTSIIIKLASHNFRLEEGFFKRNRVNQLSIQGEYNGNEQIEIESNAFVGNAAPFQEIKLINCHSIIFRNAAFSGQFKINVTNSHDVIIYPGAFQNTSFEGYFEYIDDLRMQEQAFNNAKAKLYIAHSNIEDLYRFEASLREIQFFNCTIGNVNTGTFDVISISLIVFDKCKINKFKSRAITEKLYSNHLAITGGIIGIIESEAIWGSGIAEIILSRNEIEIIQENAIHVTAVNATITSNRIKHLGDSWLHVKDWSTMTIAKNKFGEFGSIVLEKTKNPTSCQFESNFITNPKPNSLNITNPYCKMRELFFNRPCSCNTSWLEQLSSRDLRSESYCTVENILKTCFNASIFNVRKYMVEVCDYSKTTLDCLENRKLKKIDGEFISPQELESNDSIYIIYGLILVSVFVILAIIITFITIKCSSVRREPIKGTNEFSNNELRVINETLKIIKLKYSDVYEPINAGTQDLLRGNITENQRVIAIGNIIQGLQKCQNSGVDFVAFNDILDRHLNGPGPTAPPLETNYDELLQQNLTNDNRNDVDDITNSQTNINHIYAEPNNLSQQPLLHNEYALPSDHNNELTNIYSEPMIYNKERNIITPYAVANPISPLSSKIQTKSRTEQIHPYAQSEIVSPQQPSTSKSNLPDVLNNNNNNSSIICKENNEKPLTEVQRIAQNLSTNPNFHITRSPNSNRRIPKYTIPNKGRKTTSENNFDDKFDASTSSKAMECTGKINEGATGFNSDSGSNHSGGSNITIKIDDIIEYADA